jgi:hypothetical protein
MSIKSGFQSTIIPLTVGSTASGTSYTNGGLPLVTLQPGRYLVILNLPIGPVTVGSNMTSTTMIVTGGAVAGGVGAFGLCQLQQSATAATDVISRQGCSNIFDISVPTQVFITISATVSAGNWRTSTSFQDGACRNLSFLKIQ